MSRSLEQTQEDAQIIMSHLSQVTNGLREGGIDGAEKIINNIGNGTFQTRDKQGAIELYVTLLLMYASQVANTEED